MSSQHRVRSASLFAALTLTLAATAHAQDKQACVSAYEEGQQLRKAGKLTSARARLLTCAQEGCPAVLRKDCTVWVAEVEHATPTVTLAVRGPTGKDVVDVAVSLDGKPLATHLDGKALPVDPGPHTFRFELAGEARDETILVKEGERERAVLADFQPPGARTASLSASSVPMPERARRAPAGTWIFGAIGVAGVGTSLGFGLWGMSEKGKLDACKPNCDASAVDKVRTKFLVADVGLFVGVGSLVVATILYVTRGEAPIETGLHVDVGPTDLRLRGTF